jgi:long-subunit acyl-CoA synthetase (AMP-forming)
MMKILALSHDVPGATNEQFRPHLKAEAARVWELVQSGIVREIYMRPDISSAVIMLECGSVAEARTVLDTLPLVREKLIAFEVAALEPYAGFARLFSN